MKYIDAEKLRAEIKKRLNWKGKIQTSYYMGCRDELKELLSFLDTLPDEPEQPTRGYDEAYLNEKIAKASKSWEGVDVDKFMDEVRGREHVSEDLEEAAEKRAIEYAEKEKPKDADGEIWRVGDVMIENRMSFEDGFKAGAEWMKAKMMKIITKDDNLEEAGTQYVETYFRDIDWTPDVIKSCLEEAFISGGEYVFKQIKYEQN